MMAKEGLMPNHTQPCTVDGCDRQVGRKGARGLCSRHYQRLRDTGSPTGTRRPTAEARFFAKVVESAAGCWLWTASKTLDGYGSFSGRPGGVTIRSHIWAYEHLIGPVPAGLQLDHLCRKRSCVNPWHLDPVTSRVNTLRGDTVQAVNACKERCKRGHPFTPENTYITKPGSRSCRICLAMHRANYEQRKSA
jgi:hypothetical protein